MFLVTYASDPSRISFREPVLNLWGGEPYIGLMQKIHAVQRFVYEVAPESLVCFVDGYDVQLEVSVPVIETRYRSLGVSGVLMNAEANCFPYPDREADYPEGDTPFRFVNSGCYIGTAGEIRKLFDAMRVDRIPAEVNDQAIFTEYYLANPNAFTLDTECRLFQCLFRAGEWVKRENGIYINTLTGTRPLVLHANGGADLPKE